MIASMKCDMWLTFVALVFQSIALALLLVRAQPLVVTSDLGINTDSSPPGASRLAVSDTTLLDGAQTDLCGRLIPGDWD